MEFRVSRETIIRCGKSIDEWRSEITPEDFDFLIGKKIKWNIRFGKKISIERNRTRIKVMDSEFISGEHYRKNRKVYKCEYVNNDGTALLTPRGNALKAITARDTKDWEIL